MLLCTPRALCQDLGLNIFSSPTHSAFKTPFYSPVCEHQVCDAWPARGGQEQHCQQSSWLRQPCQPRQEEEQEEGGFCKQIQMINGDTKNKGK